MNSPISRLTGMVTIVLALFLSISSCEKESIKPVVKTKLQKKSDNVNAVKTLHCAPWRDVYGCTEATADLNDVGFCNTSACSGSQTTMNINNMTVHETGDSNPMYLSDWDPITIAEQNVIWNQAVSEATAMVPPGGYTLAGIHNFRIQVVSIGMLLTNIMKYDITYKKCTGGGGSGS